MKGRKAALGTVFLIVFIDLIGFGIVIPILPLYAEDFGPSPVVFGLLMASFSAMQFVFAPILGRLSDRVGRRPVLLVSLVGSAVGYVIFGFAGSLLMLFVSRIVDGISGGNISTAQAVIADITTPEERAKGMGLIGAAFGLGFILGPAVGGLLIQVAPWLPGIAAATASLVAFAMVFFLLPESLDPETRRRTSHRTFTLGSLAEAVGHPFVWACLVSVFLIILAFSNFETTFAQFAVRVHDFTRSNVYWLFVYAGVLGALVQGGLVRHLAPRLGEARLVFFGTMLAALSLGLMPYVGTKPLLLAVLALLAFGQGLASPSLSAMTSKLVDADEVGGVMGVYQGLSSLARIIGPFWGEWVYGQIGVAWPYRTGAVLMLGACGVAGLSLLKVPRRPTESR